MTTEIVKIDPKQFGLEESKAQKMREGLNPILAEREVLAAQYAEVVTMELNDATLKLARELRLKIRDNRTKGIEAWHKVNKEFYLRGGQFVDAIKKAEVFENERMESNLMEIEKHFENLEKKRLDDLHNERLEKVRPYVDDVTGLDFRTMPEDVFEPYLASKIKAHNDRIEAERLEAERIESERLAEIERQKQLAIEAEKARIENEKLQAQLKKEREEAEAKQRAIEEQARKEREEAEKKAREEKAKQDAIIAQQQKAAQEAAEKARIERESLEAKLKQEAEAKAKAEAELKAKQEAELKAKADAENMADKPKFDAMISELEAFKTKYSFNAKKYKDLQKSVNDLIDKIIVYANQKN